jgi:hypothetical protein
MYFMSSQLYNIYRERVGLSCYAIVRIIPVLWIISSFSKSKYSIQTAQNDLHMKTLLGAKFYIFFEVLFLLFFKIV